MKELTIGQKAQRYNEAIRVAKSKIKNDKDHVLYEKDITDIFPELKELNDENIRKELISIVTWSTSYSASGVTKEDADNLIAWLEKQAQKPAEWSEEDLVRIENCISLIGKTGDGEVKWLKDLKDRVQPQPQWKPSEEQMDALDDVISSRDIKYDVLSELWKDLKKLREE